MLFMGAIQLRAKIVSLIQAQENEEFLAAIHSILRSAATPEPGKMWAELSASEQQLILDELDGVEKGKELIDADEVLRNLR